MTGNSLRSRIRIGLAAVCLILVFQSPPPRLLGQETGLFLYARTRDGVVRILPSGKQETIVSQTAGMSLEILNNELYLNNQTHGSDILVYDLEGNYARTIPMPPEASSYLYFVVIPDGRIVLMDNLNDKLFFVNSSGILLATVNISDTPGNQLQNLDGVVVNNQLIFSEDGQKRILTVDLASYQKSVLRDLSSLPGVWLGQISYADGQYYLATASTIYRFSETSPVIEVATIPEGNITGLVLDGSFAYGSVNFVGRVYRVDLDSGSSTVHTSGLNYPTDLEGVMVESPTTTLVPDPSALTSPTPPMNVTLFASNARNVELVGQIGGATGAVAVRGDFAYVDIGPRLVILNVANPTRPMIVGQTSALPGVVVDIVLLNQYAYVAALEGGLWVIDVSDPRVPVELGFYDTPGEAGAVTVAGDIAYVADGERGLRLIDVSNPRAPVGLGSYETPGRALDVTVAGDIAHVTDWDGGLHMIDVTNPSLPVEVGSYDTPGPTGKVTVVGNTAYIADQPGGLRLIDISNPRTPFEMGSYDTPGAAIGVKVAGNIAYVADGDGSLRIIDVSDPRAPFEVSFYSTPGYALDVTVAGDVAFVADEGGGLLILRYTGGVGAGVVESPMQQPTLSLPPDTPTPKPTLMATPTATATAASVAAIATPEPPEPVSSEAAPDSTPPEPAERSETIQFTRESLFVMGGLGSIVALVIGTLLLRRRSRVVQPAATANRFCTHCGAKYPSFGRYCIKCGRERGDK